MDDVQGELKLPQSKTARCRSVPGRPKCWNSLNWTQQRIQFGRARGAGMTDEEIKQVVPLCQKCMTVYLRERRTGKSTPVPE